MSGAAANPADGASRRPAPVEEQVVVAEATRFDLAPRRGGPAYRIFLRRPPGRAPEEGWPVLFLLDGNAVFATAVDAMRAQAPYPLGTGIDDGVVVAIGYPTDAAFDSVRRSFDLGPPPGTTYPPFTPGGPEVRTGGADLFLDFIEEELKPALALLLPLDTTRQAIFGHSFGGLYVLHALARKPRAFSSWIAASPAIWWDDWALLQTLDAFERGAPADLALGLLLLAGEYEEKLAPFQTAAEDAIRRRESQAAHRTVSAARETAERLGRLGGIEACFRELADETHMSVLPSAVGQAVRFAFARRGRHGRQADASGGNAPTTDIHASKGT